MIALVALVCAAPFVSAWVAYYFIQPSGGKSYGELLPTRQITPLELPAADAEKWRGKWRLVLLTPADCADECRDALYATRQARTMLGRDRERLVRVAVTPRPLDQQVINDNADLVPFSSTVALPDTWRDVLSRGIVLVDPLGNQVMLWPKNPDIKKLNKDLARLMRASRIG
jgi:hypothetical protein